MNGFSFVSLGIVALGGAVGSALRYGMVQCIARFAPQHFPFGTLAVNVLGSLLIGLLMARVAVQQSEPLRLLLVVGVLGGFTTFSAFAWDALQLLQRGQFALAAWYVAGSVGLSVLAAGAGVYFARIGG